MAHPASLCNLHNGLLYYTHPKKRLGAKGLLYEKGETERVSGLGDKAHLEANVPHLTLGD